MRQTFDALFLFGLVVSRRCILSVCCYLQVKVLVDVRKWTYIAAAVATAAAAAAVALLMGRGRGGGGLGRRSALPLR